MTVTEIEGGFSVKPSELNLIQLTQLNQMLGRKIDEIQAQRLQLKVLIEARLAAGETEAKLMGEQAASAGVDGVAPGTVLELSTKG